MPAPTTTTSHSMGGWETGGEVMYGRVIFAAIAALFVFPLVAELALGIEVSVWGPIEMAMVTAVILGIDAFWWWVLFIRTEPPIDAATAPGSVPPTPRALRQAMALPDAPRSTGGQRALFEFKAWQTLIVLAVIGGFWLFTGGDLEHGVGGDEIGPVGGARSDADADPGGSPLHRSDR